MRNVLGGVESKHHTKPVTYAGNCSLLVYVQHNTPMNPQPLSPHPLCPSRLSSHRVTTPTHLLQKSYEFGVGPHAYVQGTPDSTSLLR